MTRRSMRATVGRIIEMWRSGMHGSRCLSSSPLAVPHREIFESGELTNERQLDDARRAVSLFADDELGHPLVVGGRLILVPVEILTIDERDHVGVLFEGAGLAKIRQLRAVV